MAQLEGGGGGGGSVSVSGACGSVIAQCIYTLKEIKTNFIYFSAFLGYIIQL